MIIFILKVYFHYFDCSLVETGVVGPNPFFMTSAVILTRC